MNKDLLIVVPYRNREEHLKLFLENAPKYFNSIDLSYDILICELDQIGDWNAGLSVNSLIDFIGKDNNSYEWLYIHHVDIWPVEGEWIFPEKNEVYFNLGDYGSCLMKMDAFFKVDGYCNSFWGWGGEDNELYEKLKQDGFNVINFDEKKHIKYNTDLQGHSRKFNGKNYANAIKQSMIIPRCQRSNIKHFNDHAYTKNLEQINNNIYKQIIVPKQKSPSDTINKKLIITYLKNISSFDKISTYIKTGQLHSSYEFDMAVMLADNKPDGHLTYELEQFGIKHVPWNPQVDNIHLDKYYAYEKFLKEDNNYEFILHVDIVGSIFQDNPFEKINLNKINLFKENNKAIIGAFAADKDNFLKFCSLVIEESKKFNLNEEKVDEKIINSIIENKKISNELIEYKTTEDSFYVNLKLSKDTMIHNDRKILNNKNEKYSIVDECEYEKKFKETADNHFKRFFFPL